MVFTQRPDLKKGVTLVELLIVLSIIGILAAIVVPNLSSYRLTYRLNQDAREIMSQMQLAKIQAVRRHARCVVKFSNIGYAPQGGVGSFEVFLDGDSDWTSGGADDEVILPSRTMQSGISLYQAVFTDNEGGEANTLMVGFEPSGLAARSKNNGLFVFGDCRLRNVNEYLRIRVTATGMLKLEESGDGINWN